MHQKYSAVHHIFNSLPSVSSGHETLHLMLDILLLKCPRSYIDPGGDTLSSPPVMRVPNWLFWLQDLPNLKARIWDLKTWWDLWLKVCSGCGMPKIATVNSLYCRHWRDLELVSSLARVRNSRNFFCQRSVIYFCLGFSCCPYYWCVRYSGVSARQELTISGLRD